MFAFKQFVGVLFMPLPLAFLLIASGLLAKRFGRKTSYRVLVVGGSLVGVLATLGVVGNSALILLETRYASVIDAKQLPSAPRYIVVLGSGYRPRDELPITSALSAVALARVTEGVRLQRQLPGTTLVLSGGGVEDNPPSARGYEKAAEALGVSPQSIILIDDPLDTGAEIRALKKLVGDEPVLLVTSAAHMPRAMAHCLRIGVHAIPAATGHLAEPPSTWGLGTWFLPSGTQLRKTETAFHEYLGLAALRFGIT